MKSRSLTKNPPPRLNIKKLTQNLSGTFLEPKSADQHFVLENVGPTHQMATEDQSSRFKRPFRQSSRRIKYPNPYGIDLYESHQPAQPVLDSSSIEHEPVRYDKTDRSKTSFTSIPINNQPAEGLAISSHASLHKNSTAGSFLLNATLTHQPDGALPSAPSNFQLSSRKSRLTTAPIASKVMTSENLVYPAISMSHKVVPAPKKNQMIQRQRQTYQQGISVHLGSLTAGESSFQEAVKLNNSFNLRTQRNKSMNHNVRPANRSKLFGDRKTSGNRNNVYAQRAMARLECLKDPESVSAYSSTKKHVATRSVAFQKLKDSSLSDIGAPVHTEVVHVAQVINSNSSENILIEPSMITTPLTPHTIATKPKDTPMVTPKAIDGADRKFSGIYDSAEQSQFIHGSSIDQGPTSPRGGLWGSDGNSLNNSGGGISPRELPPPPMPTQKPTAPLPEPKRPPSKNQQGSKRPRSQNKMVEHPVSSKRDLAPKSPVNIQLEQQGIQRGFSHTYLSEKSMTRLLGGGGAESPDLNFSPVSGQNLHPDMTKYSPKIRCLVPGSLPVREQRNPPRPIFMPSSRKPNQARVVNYKSCSAKNMLRVSAFDQRVWAPQMQGYLTLQSKHRQHLHFSGALNQNSIKDFVSQQRSVPNRSSTFYRAHPRRVELPRPDSSHTSQRVTTSVLSKHRNLVKIPGAKPPKRPSFLRSNAEVKSAKQPRIITNPPSLVAEGLHREMTRSKSVNTQTQGSVGPNRGRDTSEMFLSRSSSTPQIILPLGSSHLDPTNVNTLGLRSLGPEAEYQVSGRKKTNTSRLGNQLYESMDYSQMANANLQPKISPPLRLKTFGSSDNLSKAPLSRKQESFNSLQSSAHPHSPYPRKLDYDKSEPLSRQNSNQPKLAAFTFDVEVKKNRPKRPKKKGKQNMTMDKGLPESPRAEADSPKSPQAKQVSTPPSTSPKQTKRSVNKPSPTKLESPKQAIKPKQFHLEASTVPPEEANFPHLRPGSPSSKAMSAGGGNMKVFRGKALLFGTQRTLSPPPLSEQNEEIVNIEENQEAGRQSSPESAGQESEYKSLEQQEMSLRNSIDKGVLYKKASLSPKQRHKGVFSSDSLTKKPKKEEETYGCLSERYKSSNMLDSIGSPTKKRIISKYKRKNRNSHTPKATSSKLESKSLYKSQFTDLTGPSHGDNSQVDHQQIALVDVLGMSNTVTTLKEDAHEEEDVLTKLEELASHDSPLNSPLPTRLPVQPLNRRTVTPSPKTRTPSRIEFGEMDSGRKGALEISSPQYSATQGLPSMTYQSEGLKSAVGVSTTKHSPSKMLVQMTTGKQKSAAPEVNRGSPLKAGGSHPPATPVGEQALIKRAQRAQMQGEKRVPFSMSSIQLVPVEDLELQQLQRASLADSSLKSHFKHVRSQKELKDQKKEQQAQNRRQIPKKLKRPFIGSKNIPGPVPPYHLSPYSSKHGRITKRSAGAWCQMPQNMVNTVRSHTPAASTRNVWGFYSAGPQQWSQMFKQATEKTHHSSAHLDSSNFGQQLVMGASSSELGDVQRPSSKVSSVNRPMTTPELRQRTIAIKMKSIAYEESIHTSKEILNVSMSGRRISEIPNSPSSYLNRSNSYVQFRSRANSMNAESILQVARVASKGGGLKVPDYQTMRRSARTLPKVSLPGDIPRRSCSGVLVVQEDPQEGVYSARKE